MTNNRRILTNYRADTKDTTVRCSNGQHLAVHGRGDIILKQHNIKLSDVLYVPKLTQTLIATKSLTDQKLHINIGKTSKFTRDENGSLLLGNKTTSTSCPKQASSNTKQMKQSHSNKLTKDLVTHQQKDLQGYKTPRKTSASRPHQETSAISAPKAKLSDNHFRRSARRNRQDAMKSSRAISKALCKSTAAKVIVTSSRSTAYIQNGHGLPFSSRRQLTRYLKQPNSLSQTHKRKPGRE
jgi:hypothetical protein